MKYQKVVYEPEDDVLNIWLAKKPIDYAEDENGMIVHYTKDGEPVYIEILDATKFLSRSKQPLSPRSPVSVSHRIR